MNSTSEPDILVSFILFVLWLKSQAQSASFNLLLQRFTRSFFHLIFLMISYRVSPVSSPDRQVSPARQDISCFTSSPSSATSSSRVSPDRPETSSFGYFSRFSVNESQFNHLASMRLLCNSLSCPFGFDLSFFFSLLKSVRTFPR